MKAESGNNICLVFAECYYCYVSESLEKESRGETDKLVEAVCGSEDQRRVLAAEIKRSR